MSGSQHPARSNQSPSTGVMVTAAVLNLQGDLRTTRDCKNANLHLCMWRDRCHITCQGQLWGRASSPFTTLLVSGGTAGVPHPKTTNQRQPTFHLVLRLMLDTCLVTHRMLPAAAGRPTSASWCQSVRPHGRSLYWTGGRLLSASTADWSWEKTFCSTDASLGSARSLHGWKNRRGQTYHPQLHKKAANVLELLISGIKKVILPQWRIKWEV